MNRFIVAIDLSQCIIGKLTETSNNTFIGETMKNFSIQKVSTQKLILRHLFRKVH